MGQRLSNSPVIPRLLGIEATENQCVDVGVDSVSQIQDDESLLEGLDYVDNNPDRNGPNSARDLTSGVVTCGLQKLLCIGVHPRSESLGQIAVQPLVVIVSRVHLVGLEQAVEIDKCVIGLT